MAGELLDGMLRTRTSSASAHPDPTWPRQPECPRCSWPYVLPVSREEEIQALRGELTPSELASTDVHHHWVCEACGYGWAHERTETEPEPAAWVLEETGSRPEPRPRPWRALGITLLVIGALAAGALRYGLLGLDRAAGRGSTPPPSASTSAPTNPHAIRAVMTLDQPTWIRAVADGRVLKRSTVQPGHAVVFRARKSLHLEIGNGAAAHLRVDGKRVKTGPDPTLVRLTFVRVHGQIRTRTA